MRRTEVAVLFLIAVALVTTSVTWLFGPFGLLGVGLVLGVSTLALIDVKDD